MENVTTKFQDFPGFPGPVWTFYNILFQYIDNPEGRYRLSLHTGQVPHQARGGFSSMKQLGVLLLLPGWEVIHSTDTGPSIGQYNISPSTVNMSAKNRQQHWALHRPTATDQIHQYINWYVVQHSVATLADSMSADTLTDMLIDKWPTFGQYFATPKD